MNCRFVSRCGSAATGPSFAYPSSVDHADAPCASGTHEDSDTHSPDNAQLPRGPETAELVRKIEANQSAQYAAHLHHGGDVAESVGLLGLGALIKTKTLPEWLERRRCTDETLVNAAGSAHQTEDEDAIPQPPVEHLPWGVLQLLLVQHVVLDSIRSNGRYSGETATTEREAIVHAQPDHIYLPIFSISVAMITLGDLSAPSIAPATTSNSYAVAHVAS